MVDTMFDHLDELRDHLHERREYVLRRFAPGTPQATSERDAYAALYTDRLRQLDSVEDGLVFGRLDHTDLARGSQYVGRIGLRGTDREQLLTDWRAPAAQGFYQATASNPGTVRRRRHLKVRHRRVVAVQDDLMSPLPTDGEADTPPVVADAALLAAVNEPRGAKMRDIVVTLQAEQDRIIRSPLNGVLVVQGAPGTGKTAVALHRAAYLLYTHRSRLGASGVLLIGPTSRFLSYIEDVLPNLGETSVVSATIGDLYPGVAASRSDEGATAAVKGDPRMAHVLRHAVRLRRRMPRSPIPLNVEDACIALTPALVEAGHRAALRTGEPHNQAREEFCRVVLDDLVAQLAAATGEADIESGRGELLQLLHAAADVRREVNLCWMPLDPATLLERLWRDPELLAEAASQWLTAEEQALLHRMPDEVGWSADDIPLLDELAELIGDPPETGVDRAAKRREAAERAEERRFAEDSLASLGIDKSLVSAEVLADRYRAPLAATAMSDHLAHDRTWTFGHLVVDEAQELSHMAWRMLIRRCPTRSMTVVGDVDQVTGPVGAHDWAEVLDVHAPGRWRMEQLSVNYRTPGAVMSLAQRVIASASRLEISHAPTRPAVRSLRSGQAPTVVELADLDRETLKELGARTAREGEGTCAIVVPDTYGYLVGPDRPAGSLGNAQGVATSAGDADARHERPGVPILTATESKGLEFDTVVVVEPSAFIELGEQGRRQLYVALTRATQRLVVAHSRPLPGEFADLRQLA